jgi:hypothetical protein
MTVPGPDWVEQARRFAAGLAAEHSGTGLGDVLGGLLGGPAPADDASAEPGAECRSCPLCAGLAALRGRRPDLLEALADLLSGAATALRTTTGSDAGPVPDATAPDVPADVPLPPEETVSHPAPAPTVQRIDVA